MAADIDRFWKAYDRGVSGKLEDALEDEYLDQASPGLEAFTERRIESAAKLAQAVSQARRYYESIRTSSLRLARDEEVIAPVRENFRRVKALYPAAVFPPTYFLIGRFNSGGTIDDQGLLIGAEFYTKVSTSPLDELTPFQRTNAHDVSMLPVIVAHEHVHVLQSRASSLYSKPDKTLLEQCLIEGGADFVAELVSGGNINAHLRDYSETRQQELWLDFKQNMNGTDVSRWLYNQERSTDRPGDLGYDLGYRIAKAYYGRAADKTNAVAEIIGVSDAAQFLDRSGYEAEVSAR